MAFKKREKKGTRKERKRGGDCRTAHTHTHRAAGWKKEVKAEKKEEKPDAYVMRREVL
jgi:hypothetical protein